MRENCTYGSMRGRAYPIMSRSTLHPHPLQQPVQQTQNVWVEGRYVDQVQANGSTVRIWQPGHYEQQTVVIQ